MESTSLNGKYLSECKVALVFRSKIWCWRWRGWPCPYITVLPLDDVQCLGECKVTHSGFQVGDLVLELEGVDVLFITTMPLSSFYSHSLIVK